MPPAAFAPIGRVGMSSSDNNGAVAEQLPKLAIALSLIVLITGSVLTPSMHGIPFDLCDAWCATVATYDGKVRADVPDLGTTC